MTGRVLGPARSAPLEASADPLERCSGSGPLKSVLIGFLLLGTLHALSAAALAQVTVSARFDRPSVIVGETIILEVQVKSSGGAATNAKPRLPAGLDLFFDVLGSGTSMQMTTGTGGTSVTEVLTYQLRAKKSGEVLLEPVQVQTGSAVFESQRLRIRIQEALTPEEARKQGQTVPYLAEMRAELPSKIYPGQEIPLALVLSAVVPFNRWGGGVLQTSGKLRMVEVPLPRSASLTPSERGGVTYQSAVVRQWVVYPLVSGDFEIPGLPVDLYLSAPGASFLPAPNSPLNALMQRMAGRTVQAQTTPIPFHAEPLPLEGRPSDFAGAVGVITPFAQPQARNVEVGQAFPYVVQLRMHGDADAVVPPKLSLPPALDSFDVKVDTNANASPDGGVETLKQFTYLLVARRPGRYDFSPLAFSWFDPEAGAYRSWQAPSVTLGVTGEAELGSVAPAQGQGAKPATAELRYIKPDAASLALVAPPPWRRGPLWAATLASPLAFAFALGFSRRRVREQIDRTWARYRGARRRLREALSRAESASTQVEALSQLAGALLTLISDLWDFEAQGLTQEQLTSRLRERGVSEEALKETLAVLGSADEARFSGGVTSVDRGEWLGRVKVLAEKLREARG